MNRPRSETVLNLIDEPMLKKAILEQAPRDEVKRILKQEGIHFHEVVKLRLDFRNIPRIDSLWDFSSLDRLDLNNNLIEKIEGLDHLFNLTWLNLSYNKLEKIEGLESLKKLQLLNLSNNKISVIENMDALERLIQFCIGNNLVGQLDNVLYLRRFKKLYTLILSGNPASEGEDYKLFIAAYFPNLTFLDNKLIHTQTKTEASEKYQSALEKLRLVELQKQQAQDAKKKPELGDITGFLKGSYLSESLLKIDPKAETLRCVPELAQEMEKFEHQMLELCTRIVEFSLAENNSRESEVNSFVSAQSKAMKDYQRKVSQMMADFEEQHRKRLVELQQISDLDLTKEKIKNCNDEISQLGNSFMEMEYLHVSQIKDIIKRLDTNLSDMVDKFSETLQGLFTKCRDLEEGFHSDMHQIAAKTVEKVANDDMEEDMPDDVKALFTDGDTVMDVLDTAHDNRLLRISDRETQLVSHVSAWKDTLVNGIQDKKLKGNQTRLSDYQRYLDLLREQLEDFQ